MQLAHVRVWDDRHRHWHLQGRIALHAQCGVVVSRLVHTHRRGGREQQGNRQVA